MERGRLHVAVVALVVFATTVTGGEFRLRPVDVMGFIESPVVYTTPLRKRFISARTSVQSVITKSSNGS